VLSPDELEVATAYLGADPDSPAAPRPITRRQGHAGDTAAVDAVLAKLLDARAARPRPQVDEKLICAWNALAVRGLLDAGEVYGDQTMTVKGLDLLAVLLERCATPTGVLRCPDDPSVADVRLIEDSASLAAACLTAHDVTGERDWLSAAVDLHDSAIATFADDHSLYMVPETTDLPVRAREQSDEPTPSGAATLIDNAVRLFETTGDIAYGDFARGALRGLWSLADYAPEHSGRILEAATRLASLAE
jgi:hypothetical protein